MRDVPQILAKIIIFRNQNFLFQLLLSGTCQLSSILNQCALQQPHFLLLKKSPCYCDWWSFLSAKCFLLLTQMNDCRHDFVYLNPCWNPYSQQSPYQDLYFLLLFSLPTKHRQVSRHQCSHFFDLVDRFVRLFYSAIFVVIKADFIALVMHLADLNFWTVTASRQ